MRTLLQIEDLTVYFDTEDGRIYAAEDVSFRLGERESVGLVGESGCGKSVTGLSILRLIPQPPGRIEAGRILFRGNDLLQLPVDELRKVRGRSIGMIFQEPVAALSPLHRIGDQLVETLRTHERVSRRAAREVTAKWLAKVGIPDADRVMHAYPHQLSGGMCQRVMIAMVLMLGPVLVIADEPTTALDVTIQAQILDLLLEMTSGNSSLLLITHDMGIVWKMCTRMVVMYAAEIVEVGPTRDVFRAPLHPYTGALLASIPPLSSRRKRLVALAGQVPSALAYPSGCRFRDRCPCAFDRCAREHPMLFHVGRGRFARCFLREAGEQPYSDGGAIPSSGEKGEGRVST